MKEISRQGKKIYLIDRAEILLKVSPMNNLWKRGLGLIFLLIALTSRISAAEHFVSVNNSFSPSNLSINIGDIVTWINQDDFFTHTVTSSSGAWAEIFLDPAGEAGDTASLLFTSGGTYPYFDRVGGTGSITVLAANTPPSVTITNPVAGATFTAPATFLFRASASDPGGSVASVQFFVDGTSIGTDTTANPYSATASSLFAGDHTLSAVATDNLGLKATNSISISVTNPVISLSAPKILNGEFQFTISGLVAGKTNLIQSSANLTAWTAVRTNLAAASTATFTNTQTAASTPKFFRVIQLP
jgi:hypothetical protein